MLGIVNLTPDSFSDGGLFNLPETALEHSLTLLQEGADFVDIGAESTRPGSTEVAEDEEWARLEPALARLHKEGLINKVSVDTRKFVLMKRVTEMGVSYINCVGSIPEVEELNLLFSINPNLRFIATHVHGTPETMQLNPLTSKSAIKRVAAYFESCTADLLEAGCAGQNIFMDPGIGFGKTDTANWQLILNTASFSKDYKVAVGVSRKGFIQRTIGGQNPLDRDPLSKLIECQALVAGATLVRTHEVKSLIKLSSVFSEALQ